MGPCSTILPGSKAQWLNMQQLLEGGKGYMSSNARMNGMKLSGPEAALKQRTFSGSKINWVILLTRDIVVVKVLPSGWQLCGEGMAYVAHRLAGWLRNALGPGTHLPRVVFTDRGTGMYAPAGQIVGACDRAIRGAGLRSFFGPDAKQQAADMGDLLLHETAVPWVRNHLRRNKPHCLPWVETEEQWGKCVEDAVAHVNSRFNVRNLCLAFPKRLHMCADRSGGRLRT